MYRPGTISKLVVIFFFTFAILAPHHVEAATRASLLTNMKDFLIADWQQTKADFGAMGGFLARDWKRTKEDFRAISQKLSALENKLRSGTEVNLSIRPFREKLLEHIAGTIDEMGPKAFCKAIEETTGKEMFSEKLKNADPQLARAALLNNLDKCFIQLAKQSKEQKEHTLLSHMDDAKMVLRAIKAGETPEEVAKKLVSNLTQKSSQTRENSKASDFGESILGFIVMVFSAIFFVGFLLYAVAGIGVIIAGLAAVILVTQSFGIIAGIGTGVAAVALSIVLFELGLSKGVSNVFDFVHGRL